MQGASPCAEKLLSGRWIILVGTIVTFPLFLGILFYGISMVPESYPTLDTAMTELYTNLAMHGELTVGAWGRFGWNHAGPTYFYLLAPLYWASGQSTASLFLTARLINCITVVLILALLFIMCREDELTFLCMVVLLPIFFWAAPSVVGSIWNPHIIVLPFALFLICCAGVSLGKPLLLPLMVGLGSFLTQTHVAPVPCVLALTGFSVINYCTRVTLRGRRIGKSTVIDLSASVIIFIIMWLPPLADEFFGMGNLTKLYRFFSSAPNNPISPDALFSFSRSFGWFPVILIREIIPTFEYELLKVVSSILAIILLPIVYIHAIRRRYDYRAKLALLSFIGAVVAFYACTQARDDWGYLFMWISPLGLTSWTIIGPMLLEISAKRIHYDWQVQIPAKYATAGLVFVIALTSGINTRDFVVEAKLRLDMGPRAEIVRSLSGPLANYLQQNKDKTHVIHVRWRNWVVESAVVLQLYKAGIPFCVRTAPNSTWPLLIKDRHSSAENVHMAFGYGTPKCSKEALIVKSDEAYVYILRPTPSTNQTSGRKFGRRYNGQAGILSHPLKLLLPLSSGGSNDVLSPARKRMLSSVMLCTRISHPVCAGVAKNMMTRLVRTCQPG